MCGQCAEMRYAALSPSEYFMYSATLRQGRKPSLSRQKILPGPSPARCGLDTGANPAFFHEIRSLSGRLYEARQGEAFEQRLLAHKSLSMTKKYLDPRGDKYVLI